MRQGLLVAALIVLAYPTQAQTIPANYGLCLAKSTDGKPLTSQNLGTKTIVIVCKQPKCPSGSQAILNLQTGSTTCRPLVGPAPPTDLKLQIASPEKQNPSEAV